MRGSKHTMAHRFAGIVLRHPFGIILVAALGGVLALLMTATRLTFRTNRLDLLRGTTTDNSATRMTGSSRICRGT